MNEVAEEGRHRRGKTDWYPVAVHGLSHARGKGLTPEAIWQVRGCERLGERFIQPVTQPTGGSEVLTCPQVRPSADRGPSDRTEGGPTGTTEFVGGRGGGRGRGRSTPSNRRVSA